MLSAKYCVCARVSCAREHVARVARVRELFLFFIYFSTSFFFSYSYSSSWLVADILVASLQLLRWFPTTTLAKPAGYIPPRATLRPTTFYPSSLHGHIIPGRMGRTVHLLAIRESLANLHLYTVQVVRPEGYEHWRERDECMPINIVWPVTKPPISVRSPSTFFQWGSHLKKKTKRKELVLWYDEMLVFHWGTFIQPSSISYFDEFLFFWKLSFSSVRNIDYVPYISEVVFINS